MDGAFPSGSVTPVPGTPSGGFAARAGSYAAGQAMGAHADSTARLSLVVAGHLRETVGGHEEYAAAGSLVIKLGDVVHQNLFGPQGARVVSIELPAWLADSSCAMITGRLRWFHGGPLAVSALRLWFAARQPERHPAIADLLVDFVAKAGDSGVQGRHRTPPDWLSRIRQQLADEGSRGSSLTKLATKVGVHPVYLARMFRRYFGCSVTEYAQAIRLTGAVERMARDAESLVSIAAASGYADQSHLSRSCRRGLGVSPRQCRSLLRGSGAEG